MRKKLSIVLLTCSLLLVLGHSFMPHEHFLIFTSGYSLSTERDLSLAEVIRMALSQDLGTNHLEEFNNEGDSDVVPEVTVPDIECIVVQHENQCQLPIEAEQIIFIKEPHPFGICCLSFGLRAPPSQS